MLETDGAKAASKLAKEIAMKIVQAAVLLLVGALGAMLYVKVTGKPEQPLPATQPAPQPVAAAAPVTPPVVEAPPAQPARAEKKRSTREPARTMTASRRENHAPAM